MPAARLAAGVRACLQLMTRTWSPLVDAAGRFHADLSCQRGAAWRAVVGATHSRQGVGQRHGQTGGHGAAFSLSFVDAEINAVGGAACAAGDTRVGVHPMRCATKNASADTGCVCKGDDKAIESICAVSAHLTGAVLRASIDLRELGFAARDDVHTFKRRQQ